MRSNAAARSSSAGSSTRHTGRCWPPSRCRSGTATRSTCQGWVPRYIYRDTAPTAVDAEKRGENQLIGLKKTVSFLAGLVLLAGNCILGTAARVCCRQRALSLAEACGRGQRRRRRGGGVDSSISDTCCLSLEHHG